MDIKLMENVFNITPVESRARVFAKYYREAQRSVKGGTSGTWVMVPRKLRKHVARLSNSFGFDGPELFLEHPHMLVMKIHQEHKGWHSLNWSAGKILFEYVNVG